MPGLVRLILLLICHGIVHFCMYTTTLWPRTAARRRPAARVGAPWIVLIGYVLISMRYHSHSRANGRAVAPESHRRPSGAAAERAPRALR